MGSPRQERGYAMAVLLVSLSVMAIMMTVAMPVWKQMARREKETELVFRGEQYARAIGLFQRKNGPGALPPSINVLVEQRFLRKKYKDPITNDDFAPITLSVSARPGVGQQGSGPARGSIRAVADDVAQRLRASQPGAGPAIGGNLSGVMSKSKEKSLRIYNGRNHYNEWQFVYVPPVQAPGTGGAGTGAPGIGGQRGRGGPGRGTPSSSPFNPGFRGAPDGGRSGFRVLPDGRIEVLPPSTNPNAPVPGAAPSPSGR